MSGVAAIIGFLATILAGVFWLIISQAIPAPIGGLFHLAAMIISLLVGFTLYHNLSGR